MTVQQRIKVLYIQVPPGGGSLIALYELLKHLPDSIEPVVLCYYQNKYAAILESVSRVIYLHAEKFVRNQKIRYSRSALLSFMQLQYHLLKDYLEGSRKIRKALHHIITAEQPHIIHHNNEIFLNRDAIRAGIKAGIPQVVHERSLGNYGINYINLVADTLLMQRVAGRIDISNAVAIHFDKLYPKTKDKKIVLHDIVDVKRFYSFKPAESLRTSLGIGESDMVIISIGRIIKWKGQHILIEAINLLKDKLGNFRVLFVGADDDGIGSGSYKEELIRLTSKYQLSENIIFTGNRNDIPALINLSDVVVHCSVKPEPQGLVVIETLLCNKPLIAAGAGGSGELVEKYGGIALDKVDAQQLAAKLESVLLKKEIPTINHAELKQDFNAVEQINTIINLYHKVLA